MNKCLLLLCVLTWQACSSGTSDATTTQTPPETVESLDGEKDEGTQIAAVTEVEAEPGEDQAFLGYYVGYFEGVQMDFDKDPVPFNKITISIDSVREEMLYGHSIVAGNNRPFSGPYEDMGDSLSVEAQEPGDDRYDGVFTFTILKEDQKVKGKWLANNRRLAVSERKYELEMRAFEYNPDLELPEEVSWTSLYEKYPKFPDKDEGLTEDVLKLNASQRVLKKEEVENLYRGDLEVIRNSIYARHGYSFRNRKMRFIFDSAVDWYMPVSTDIRAQLTAVEKQNIDLLKRYEQHAERYYDVFGR